MDRQGTDQNWYFTFRSSENFDKYVVLYGDFNETRIMMFKEFGHTWCMQYREDKGKEFVEKLLMKELKFPGTGKSNKGIKK